MEKLQNLALQIKEKFQICRNQILKEVENE